MELRLREERERRGLTQREVAAALGCSQKTYGRYENGVILPPLDFMERLARYYGTSVDYLMGLTNYPIPYDWVEV